MNIDRTGTAAAGWCSVPSEGFKLANGDRVPIGGGLAEFPDCDFLV